MFIGHYAPAIALAARRDAPPAWSLFVAAQFVDYLFFIAVFPGWERAAHDLTAPAALPFALEAPFTHSLLGTAVLGLLFGGVVAAFAPAGRRAPWFWISALAVLSHWFTDWLVHRPDLPLVPGSEPLGLGLWYHPLIAWPLEVGILAAATWYFGRAVPERAKTAWALMLFMVLVQVASRLMPPAASITEAAPGALIAYTVFAGLAAFALRKPKVAQ